MDHFDFVILFLSIASWLVGFGIALTAGNTRVREIAGQYRLFSFPLALFIFQEMVFYYLENGSVTELPVWVALLNRHISLTVFFLCSRSIMFLSAAMTEKPFASETVDRINVIWLTGYCLGTALLEFEAAYGTGSFLIELPAALLFIGGFISAAVLLIRRSFRLKSKRSLRVFAVIIMAVILVFLEDLVVSLFDNIIFYPYMFLVINIFFIRFLGRMLGKTIGGDLPRENIREIVTAYDISNRETDVLELLVRGKSRVEIGSALYISENTVKTHVANLYRKLDVASRSELMDLIKGGHDDAFTDI